MPQLSYKHLVLLDWFLFTVSKYILFLICPLFYQLPILFDCGQGTSLSPHSTNTFIATRTGDKRSKSTIKYLCGYNNSHTRNKTCASFSFRMSCFSVTQQCTPSCSLQNSQRHSLHFMKLTVGQLRNCIVADHMIRST